MNVTRHSVMLGTEALTALRLTADLAHYCWNAVIAGFATLYLCYSAACFLTTHWTRKILPDVRSCFRMRFIPRSIVVNDTHAFTSNRSVTVSATRSFLIWDLVEPSMCPLRRAKFQVLDTIIFLISVSMVNHFFLGKRPFKMVRHYESVLQYLAVFPSILMTVTRTDDVSVGSFAHAGAMI